MLHQIKPVYNLILSYKRVLFDCKHYMGYNNSKRGGFVLINEIKSGESKTIEFKEYILKYENLIKTIVSFSNRSGGKLIIGIKDNGEILGLNNDEINRYMENIPNVIKDSIEPMILPEFYTYNIEDKVVLVMEVLPGQATPYFIKSLGKQNGTYIRIGRTNKQADVEMFHALERRKLNISYDMDIFREVDSDDFIIIKNILGEELGVKLSNEHLLTLGIVKKVGSIYYLTNGGAIVCGELEHSVIRCGRFIGNSTYEFMDKKTYDGNIFEQIKNATNFIVSHLNVAGYFVEGDLHRRDELEIPYEIIRESVINGVLHRDYGMTGSDIKISVFNDYIDIVSPGGLSGTITIDEIYRGRSEIRNKVLAKVLLKANLIEQWGTGIPRIREACVRKGYQLPEVVEEGMFIKLRIFRKSFNEVESLDDIVRENIGSYITSSQQVTSLDIRNNRLFKDKQYSMLLKAIEKDNSITVSKISSLLDIPKSTVQRKLNNLQENGLIKRVGAKKNGCWHSLVGQEGKS